MPSPDLLHFTIEPGPLLDACEDWRNRFLAHRYAAIALCESKGSTGTWSDTPDGTTSGLSLVDPVPEGWIKREPKRNDNYHMVPATSGLSLVDPVPEWGVTQKVKRSDTYYMVPAKGPAGDAARAEIAALPPTPDPREIAKLIGHPGNDVSFNTADGRKLTDTAGHLYYPALLVWDDDEKAPIQIVANNLEPAIERIKTKYPGCTITKGLWAPPAGLKQITEAEAGLMLAQSRIDHERAVAAAEPPPSAEKSDVKTPRVNRRRRP